MNRWANTLFAFFLMLNGWSYHTNRSDPVNERNNVTGIEYQHENGNSVECTKYYNSVFKNSTACGMIVGGKHFKLKIGGVTGYTKQTLPYILPTIVKQHKSLKVELSVLPTFVYILMIKVEI